jgi:putative hydrolase of the HAD superfamily
MSSIRAVFLDLGNVIAFHEDAVLFQRMSAWGGAPPDVIRERMLALWDPINRGTLVADDLRRTVCRAAGSETPLDADAFHALWNCHFRIHQAILPLVESLLGKVKVILLSNVNEGHWHFLQPKVPLFQRFHALVLSYQLRLAKPDAELFHLALGRAQVSAEQAAFFDDVPRFVEAACALGIHGRLFTDAPTFRRQLLDLGLEV